MLSYGDKMKTAIAKVGGIMQNTQRGYACFQEKYSKVCITRAAVNENVCEDSPLNTYRLQVQWFCLLPGQLIIL